MSDKPKILIVHNRYQYAGGEDTVVKQDTSLLEKHGYQVFHYEKSNEELKQFGKLQKILLPFRTIYSIKTVKEMRKLIRENQIQIVHVHNTLPLISLSCYHVAKREGCGLVQTIHNFRFICPGALLFRDGRICEDCLKKGLRCSIQNRCYRNSKMQTMLVAVLTVFHRTIGTFHKPDFYIALTNFQKEKMAEFLPKEKIVVKANYLDEPVLPSDTKLDSQIKQYGDYFIYVGRIEYAKGIMVLLKAFCECPGKTLLILGSGPQENEVKDFLAERKMGNVHYLGFTKHEEALVYMANAKALIMPTLWYEGLPMNIIESFALAKPVIASDNNNLSSIIESGKQGFLFHAGEEADLVVKINQMAELPAEEYEAMCMEARKSFEKKYTSEAAYDKIHEIYTECIRKGSGW